MPTRTRFRVGPVTWTSGGYKPKPNKPTSMSTYIALCVLAGIVIGIPVTVALVIIFMTGFGQ
jgi:hypothetical protein